VAILSISSEASTELINIKCDLGAYLPGVYQSVKGFSFCDWSNFAV